MIRTLSNRKYPRFRFYTDLKIQGRPLIVEANPLTVTLRQRYSQRRVTTTWQAVFDLAVQHTLSGNGNGSQGPSTDGKKRRRPAFVRGKRYTPPPFVRGKRYV